MQFEQKYDYIFVQIYILTKQAGDDIILLQ